LLRLILALVAIALTALSAVAAERVKLPTEMLGTWCLDEHEASTYRRGDCQDKTDSWLQIGADGYQGHEFGCKAIKVSVDRRNPRYTVYELESRCEGLDCGHKHVAGPQRHTGDRRGAAREAMMFIATPELACTH
jgi:hypothetical protein